LLNHSDVKCQVAYDGLTFRHDAYKPSIKSTSSLFLFDWINTLWNIGSLLSRLGAQANRGTDEGIKTANKYFQQSAGVFDAILQILSTPRGRTLSMPGSTSAPLPCLSNESITFVKQLMLAQAQLCFYEKAVRDKRTSGTMKSSVIAKLAAQTHILFRATLSSCKVGVIASALDPSWSHHVEYQTTLFSAAAEYWQSQAVKELAATEARGYGEEIARLSVAEQHLVQCLNIATKYKLSPAFADGANAFLKTVTASKATAEHDNRTVYMDAVPPTQSLTEIAGLLMVKPLPIFDYYASLAAAGVPPEPPLFQQILPVEISEVKSSADDRLKEFLRSTTAQANESSNEARVVLSSVGLPGSVESYKSGGDLPESLWEKVQRIQSLGSIASIRNKIQELHATSQRVAISLSNIDDCLNKEESQDVIFRSKHSSYDAASSIVPSKILQKDLRENLAKLKSVFDLARDTSDKAVLQEILGPDSISGDATKVLAMMAQGTIPLKQLNMFDSILASSSKSQLIPLATKVVNGDSSDHSVVTDLLDVDHHIEPSASSKLDEVIHELENNLVEVAQLIEQRENMVAESTKLVPITIHTLEARLIERHSAGGGRSELLMVADDTIAGGTEEIKRSMSENISKQEELLKKILKTNEEFAKAVANDKKTVERNLVIGKVEEIMAKFYNWHAKLTAGVTFYINLQARASALLQNCDDVAYTQQLRRQEYETNLFKSYERTNQEALDHELAMKLAADMDMNASQASAPPPAPASYGMPPQSQQQQQQHSASGGWQQPPAYQPQPQSNYSYSSQGYAPAPTPNPYPMTSPPTYTSPPQYYQQQPQQPPMQAYDPNQYGIVSNQQSYGSYPQNAYQQPVPQPQPSYQQPVIQMQVPPPSNAAAPPSSDHDSKVRYSLTSYYAHLI
jgi:programmed cell death 6-interacting protein